MRIFRIREENAPRNKSEHCEIVMQKGKETLDLVIEGRLAEIAMNDYWRSLYEQWQTYGWDETKELLEYYAKNPMFKSLRQELA